MSVHSCVKKVDVVQAEKDLELCGFFIDYWSKKVGEDKPRCIMHHPETLLEAFKILLRRQYLVRIEDDHGARLLGFQLGHDEDERPVGCPFCEFHFAKPEEEDCCPAELDDDELEAWERIQSITYQ